MSPAAKLLQRQSAGESMRAQPMPVSPADASAHHNGRACGAMTIDVEDYFQVEAFAATIDRKDWDRLPQRVDRNTQRLLAMLRFLGPITGGSGAAHA